MNNNLFIAISILSASTLYTQDSNAQSSKLSVNTNRTATFMAINSAPSIPNKGRDLIHSYSNVNSASAAEKINSRALYMISEQFVFDNLSSLKKAYSVADIYFDLDDALIRPDALTVLDNLVNLMMDNPGISVATTAYSDSRMSKYNEKLAFSRAEAANAYLISKGVQSERLSIEKHGRPQMENPCNNDPSCSLAVQQLNRKTEFNIVYNGVNLGQIN